MKTTLSVLALALSVLSASAFEISPGRWSGILKSFEITGGVNLIVTESGQISGRGFRKDSGISHYSGKIEESGAFVIRERAGSKQRKYVGIAESSRFLRGKLGKYSSTTELLATKLSDSSKAGVYFGKYSGGYPWFFIAQADGKVTAYVSSAGKYLKLTGTLFGTSLRLSRGRTIEVQGRVRNGKFTGDGKDSENSFKFSASLL